MKQYRMKRSVCLVVLMFMLLLLGRSVWAAPETKDLFTLERIYNMQVSIVFDQELPTVSFIKPDGSVLEGASLRSEKGDDWVQFFLPQAEKGTWRITYDKGSNTLFEVRYSSYMDPIEIVGFSLKERTDDRLPVEFTVNGESGSYSYQIFAVVTNDDGQVTGERPLKRGQADLNKTIEVDLDLRDLYDYDRYKLRLDVSQELGVEEVFDSRLSTETFAVTGHAQNEAIENFKLLVDLTDHILYLDWHEWSRYQNCLVACFNDEVSSTEPFYTTEVSDNQASVEALFDPGAKAIRVDLTMLGYTGISETKSKTASLDHGVNFQFPETGYTNSSQLNVTYGVSGEIEAEVRVGDQTDTLKLSGNGSFSLKLASQRNQVTIQYHLDDPYLVFRRSFEIMLDDQPPMLRLPEHKSALYTSERTFILAGVTEPGCAVTVQNTSVAPDKDGTFLHTVELEAGENMIRVQAVDRAGNITAQDVVIHHVSPTGVAVTSHDQGIWGLVQDYWPLITSFLGSVVLFLSMVFISRGYRRASRRKIYVWRTLRHFSWFLTGIGISGIAFALLRYLTLRRFHESARYFELAKESLEQAYESLAKETFFADVLKYCIFATVSSLLLSVCLTLIVKMVVKRENKRMAGHSTNAAASRPPRPAMPQRQVSGNVNQPQQFCTRCGAKRSSAAKFCAKCGHPF